MNILKKKSSTAESRMKFPGFRRAVPEGKAAKAATPVPAQHDSDTDNRSNGSAGIQRPARDVRDVPRDEHAAIDSAVSSALREDAFDDLLDASPIKPMSVDEILAEPSRNARPAATSPRDEPALSESQGQSAQVAEKSKPLVPLDINVPERVGKYVLGERMGSGTCGVVHRGMDEVLGREIAIKLSPSGEKVSKDKMPGAQKAYQTEVYAAGRLRHPNIVTIYDAGQHENLNFIVMEAIDGKSLKAYGKGQTLLPIYRAIEVICECCKALDYTHRQDILHRDIKPANIMVADDGSVKLLDFGIAVGLSEESGLGRQGPTLGTPNYMSPEQILGKTLSPASDFYSLGTVLFELLTGKQLFKAKKVKDLFRTVVHQPAPTLKEFRPDLPHALSDVIEKVLSKKPERRFQSGMEMIDALSRFVEHFKIVEERTPEQKELIAVSRELPFFQSFSEADVARLIAHTTVREFRQDDVLIASGDTSRDLMVLIDGAASVQLTPPPASALHRVYGPGECIGEMGFIHGARETIHATALVDLRVLDITADTLAALPPKLHLHYYKRISDILVTRMAEQQQPFSLDCELA